MSKIITLSPELREAVVRRKIQEIISVWNKGPLALSGRDLAEEVRIVLANVAGLGKQVGDFKLTYEARTQQGRAVMILVTERHLQDIAAFHRRDKHSPAVPRVN